MGTPQDESFLGLGDGDPRFDLNKLLNQERQIGQANDPDSIEVRTISDSKYVDIYGLGDYLLHKKN